MAVLTSVVSFFFKYIYNNNFHVARKLQLLKYILGGKCNKCGEREKNLLQSTSKILCIL